MNARALARWLVVVAFACVGLFAMSALAGAQDGSTVQNTNESTDSTAASAPVTAGNTTTASSGPSATNGGRAAMVGDTSTSVDQNTSASGGPMTAGSQVSTPGDGQTEQNHNSSVGATAVGNPISAFNSVDAHNGPYADGAGASAVQEGDGNLDIVQDATALGGPGWSGSQFTEGEDTTVQNVNACGDAITDCGTAVVGGVDVFNEFGDSAIDGAPSGTGPVALSANGNAVTAGQVGDTDAVITQAAGGVSGSAVNGSQKTTGSGGTVQNENSALDDTAVSGLVTVGNAASSFVGAFASGGAAANAHQVGDASGVLDMDASGASGGAITGSQVTETSGDSTGFLTVQNRSASEDDTSVTGFANAVSDVTAFAGPSAIADLGEADASQVGAASFDVITDVHAASGDASTGAQISDADGTGTIQNGNDSLGNVALSGDACASPECGAPAGNLIFAAAGPSAEGSVNDASAVAEGDLETVVNASASAETGDALTGVQDSAVSDGATVQNNNSSSGDSSISGDAVSGNDLFATAGPYAEGTSAEAAAVWDGDLTRTEVTAGSTAASGDAMTGVQLATAEGDDGVVSDTNDSLDNVSASGDALGGNIGAFVAGAVAGLEDFGLGTGASSGGLVTATLAGDAEVLANMDASAASGDANAGVQDVESTDGVVLNTNTVDTSVASSATACASPSCTGEVIDGAGASAFVPGGNTALILAGPVATGAGTATSTMAGDATAELDQIADATSGDANAGLQLDRADGATIENSNTTSGAVAGCGELCPVVAGNDASMIVGPLASAADGFTSTATLEGDAEMDSDQEAEALGGTASTGSQLTEATDGAVVQNTNTSTDDLAATGSVTSFNGLGVDPFDPTVLFGVVGPSAFAETADASAVQDGDVLLESSQQFFAASGDATAGGQITTAGSDDLVQQNNVSNANTAVSGDVFGYNAAAGFVIAPAIDADSALAGDAALDIEQTGDAQSDAVLAGSQVVAPLSALTIDDDEESDLLEAESDDLAVEIEDESGSFHWATGEFVGSAEGVAVA